MLDIGQRFFFGLAQRACNTAQHLIVDSSLNELQPVALQAMLLSVIKDNAGFCRNLVFF